MSVDPHPRPAGLGVVIEERRRVARELHDGVLQQIAALGYRIDDATDALGPGPGHQVLQALRDDVGRLAREVRDVVGGLRAGALPAGGLGAALSSYLGALVHRSDVRVHLRLTERGPRPPAWVEHEVFAIAREAVANVLQHAHADNLWIRLATEGHGLALVVEDDGAGAAAPRPGHFGLPGMRERAERIGADLCVGVRQDGGTIVILSTAITMSPTREGEGDDNQRLARR